jgi:hypothetical protein
VRPGFIQPARRAKIAQEIKQWVGDSGVDELEEAQELLVAVLPGCGHADRVLQPPGEPDPGKCPDSMFRWVKP